MPINARYLCFSVPVSCNFISLQRENDNFILVLKKDHFEPRYVWICSSIKTNGNSDDDQLHNYRFVNNLDRVMQINNSFYRLLMKNIDYVYRDSYGDLYLDIDKYNEFIEPYLNFENSPEGESALGLQNV